MIEPIHLGLRGGVPGRPRLRRLDRRGSASGGRWTTRSPARTDLTVVLEGRPGGRIFERRPGGQEHDWGEVTIWEPPTRLGYTWHLNRDRSDATDVEIRFLPGDDGATRVEIEHRGWERLGADGEGWRDRNHGGWATLLPHYVRAAGAPPIA